ncbi:MAG: hypothetical protein PUK38_03285, partial [Coriobacteriaceae bacterium]|nr:hypothetical protein [Coriobacteriaceae bacterium]
MAMPFLFCVQVLAGPAAQALRIHGTTQEPHHRAARRRFSPSETLRTPSCSPWDIYTPIPNLAKTPAGSLSLDVTRKKSVPFECSSFLPVIRFETKQNPTKSKQINQSDALSHRKNREAVLLLLSRNKGKEEPPGNGRFQEKK